MIIIKIAVFVLVTPHGGFEFGTFGASFTAAATPSSPTTGSVFAVFVVSLATFTARGGGVEFAVEIVIEARVFRGGGDRLQGGDGLGTPRIVEDVFLGETLAEFVAGGPSRDRRPAAWGPAFFGERFFRGTTFVAAAAGGSTAGAFAPFGPSGSVFANRSVFAGGTVLTGWPIFACRAFFTYRPVFARWPVFAGRPLGAFFPGGPVAARTTVSITRASIAAATAAALVAGRTFAYFAGGRVRDDPTGRLGLGPRIVPVPFLERFPELIVAGDRFGRVGLVASLLIGESVIYDDRRGLGSRGDRGRRWFRRRGGDRIGKIEIGIDVELDPQQIGGQFAPGIVVVFG